MNVLSLTREDQPELASMLCAAFYDYPVMRFVLQSTPEYDRHLAALMEFYSSIRFVQNYPVAGIKTGGHLVAAALINEPTKEPRPLPQQELLRLKSVIGQDAFARLIQYETESSMPEPAAPHHLLGIIGVHPDHRGKGYAAALLHATKEMALQHPDSTGVFLNTEHAENVAFYQHFGYTLIAELDIATLHSWCFFLPVR